jgi:hypothetical protein
VGDGPERGQLATQVRAAGLGGNGAHACADVVRLVPRVPHDTVAAVYQALDVLVLPSISLPGQQEQFGRVLLEALACGVPVIGSASGGIPDLIRATGGGLVVPAGDPAALAQAMLRLEDARLRRGYAAAGARGIARQFTTQAVAARYAALFAAVLGQPRRPASPPCPVADAGTQSYPGSAPCGVGPTPLHAVAEAGTRRHGDAGTLGDAGQWDQPARHAPPGGWRAAR